MHRFPRIHSNRSNLAFVKDLIFPRVLCVKKTTKYERLKATGVVSSPYVEEVMLDLWKEASNIHIEVAKQISENLQKSGREVKVIPDYLMTKEDTKDVDLVCSLGGDGTFLKTASMITSNSLPILGINTDPARSVGHLCSSRIHWKQKE